MDLSEKKDFKYRHPWEIARADMVIKDFERLNIKGKVLDIGCGDNYFDSRLINDVKDIEGVWGIDINLEKDIDDGKCHFYNSYDKIKDQQFDCILLMDVLEHVEDAESFLKDVLKYRKEGGTIIITVPAFQKLFSTHDKELKHFRRYEYKTLNELITSCGLEHLEWTYFYLSLLIIRIFTKNMSLGLDQWNNDYKSIKTQIIRLILNIDATILKFLSKKGIHIPGLSIFMIIK